MFGFDSIFREVPNEVYRSLDSVGGDEKWWEVILQKSLLFFFFWRCCKVIMRMKTIEPVALFLCLVQAVELQKLILAHNNIQALKEDLRNLPQLTVLNVSHNKLTELPAAIGE